MCKKQTIALVGITLIFGLALAGQVMAQNINQNVNTEEAANTLADELSKWEKELAEITDVSILPDSPWYVLKTWWEEVQIFFTFDSVKKAEFHTKLATRRVVEAKKLVEKGKTEFAEQHLWKFRNRLEKALQKTEQAQEKGKNVDELIEKLQANNIRQQEVLSEVYEKVPDSAKEAVLSAMEKSAEGIENSMEKVQKSEQALEFKAELKNRIKNFNTNKALEIREKLELKGVFNGGDEDGEGAGGMDDSTSTNLNTSSGSQIQTETQTQNQGEDSNIQTQTQTQIQNENQD